MTDTGPSPGLQVIFAFFLGLMVAAFVGVGIYTFYPPPEARHEERLEDLRRQQEDVRAFRDAAALGEEDRARLAGLEEQVRGIEDAIRAERETWGRNTSILLVLVATLAMGIPVLRAGRLPVLDNGLLLGGVLTMVYGVGWIVATGTSYARFAVMAVALAITLGLGWARFVRRREAGPDAVAPAAVGDLASLAARLDAVERRLRAASLSLGDGGERRP